MNHIQDTANSKIKTNTVTDNDSADIVFLGESPGFQDSPVGSLPVNSKDINAGFQFLNNIHVTPTKQKVTGHHNITSPKSFTSSPQLASPKRINNLCNGSPNYRATGPMSPPNTGLVRQSPTVCRYQITNSPSYKITNRGSTKKLTHTDQTNGSATVAKTSPSVVGAEELWNKMMLENKQKASSNPDIKNPQLPDNDNLIVIDPETTPITKNDSHKTTNLQAELKSGKEVTVEDKIVKVVEENIATTKSNIMEKDEVEIERPSSRESLDSTGNQSEKKKRGRPKKQPPKIYIENLETGEGRDMDSPVSDISSTMFPVCDDKDDKDYIPGSDPKKEGSPKSKQNSPVKQCNLQESEMENCDDDVEGKCESKDNKKNDIEKRADRKRRLLSEGDKTEMNVSSEVPVKDKPNSLTSSDDSSPSLGNHLPKVVNDKQFKSLKNLSASVRNAKMKSKHARFVEMRAEAKRKKALEQERNNQKTDFSSNNSQPEQYCDEVLNKESKVSQDTIELVNEKCETNCDSMNAKTFDVKAHAENSRLSATLETENSQCNVEKKIFEKKSRPDKQKRKGVVKNIGSVISSLFGENFMSMADSSGFVVNVRLDVQKKTSEVEIPKSTHNVFTKEEKDSSCLSTNIFKNVSSSSDPQEGCSHSISKKSRIDKIDPKTLSNAELCAILKKRISEHPVIDNEMKAAVMDSIQYAKKLLDS